MKIERSAVVRRPLTDVYAFLADPARVSEWREDLVSSERVSPPGEIDGALYRETLATPLGPQTATVRFSVEPPHRFGFEVLDGPLRPKGSIGLTERGLETELLYAVELEPMFKIPTPMDQAAAAFLGRSVERSLARLKSILDR